MPLDAAIAAGARRFVHVSSVRAFGDLGWPDQVTEDYPVRNDGGSYVAATSEWIGYFERSSTPTVAR